MADNAVPACAPIVQRIEPLSVVARIVEGSCSPDGGDSGPRGNRGGTQPAKRWVSVTEAIEATRPARLRCFYDWYSRRWYALDGGR